MSDRSRDEKLVAARKRLKKFQENSKQKGKKEEDIPEVLSNTVNQVSNKNSAPPCDERISQLSEQSDLIQTTPSSIKEILVHHDEPNATSEGLKQISRHLNGIISCSSSSIDRESQQEYLNTIRDLENRNIELAMFNSQKAEQLEFLNAKVNSLNENIERITRDYGNEKQNSDNSYKRQMESLKDQLQAQIHTISLLVAEKSELQSQVSHNQKVAVQKQQDIEELTNKLKTSRQKVGDLEKSLSDMKSCSEKLEEARRDMSRQSESLRNNVRQLKSEKDDLTSECSQLRSKLISKNQEFSNLELTLDDIKSQLDMSQVQIRQLTNSQEGHYDDIYTQLQTTEKKNVELVTQLENMKLSLQQAESKNLHTQNQYRTYFDQMEERITSLQRESATSREEKAYYMQMVENLQRKLSENQYLEDRISEFSNKLAELESERTDLLKRNTELEALIASMNDKTKSTTTDNEQLSKLIEELEEKNISLMETVSTLESNKVDHALLLNQVQSDKTALSRALSQNKQLKSQLIELQEAFVKLSSDNMELSTQLQHEQHVSKELAMRLGEQEDELTEMRQTLLKKDDEIKKLAQCHQQVTEELLTLNGHFESDHDRNGDHSKSNIVTASRELIEGLQNELTSAQERINHLTNENNNLKYQINFGSQKLEPSRETNTGNELILTIRQLEAERDELLAKCEVFNIKETELEKRFQLLKQANDENGIIVTVEKYHIMQDSLAELNRKLEKLMNENAQIREERDRLDHMVAQLEGETDTIGEYISLYQHQRAILKQRSSLRDQFMSKFVHQKKLLDSRLMSLENLLRTILNDDGHKHQHSMMNGVGPDDNRSLIVGQLFSIISEMQKSNNTLTECPAPNNNLPNNPQNTVSLSNVPGELSNSDELTNFKIIHCKCCVGKVIDL